MPETTTPSPPEPARRETATVPYATPEGALPGHMGKTSGTGGWMVLLWPILALASLLVFNFFYTDRFFDLTIRDGHLYGTLVDVLDRAAPTAIVAIGMTLVIATGGIDLSVGAVVAIAGAVAATLMAEGWSVPAAMAGGLLACMAGGAINGLLVARIGVQPIVATLILMVAGRGIAQMVGQKVAIGADQTGFLFIGNGHFLGLPFTITLALVMLLATALLMRGTALGLFVESVGNNPIASRYAGLRLRSIVFFVYVFSGLCAGVAGFIKASDIEQSDAINAGLYLELDAILAVVVGGTALTGGRFFLVGSVIGALLIQTLETTIVSRNIPSDYALVVKALVVLAVCLLQSPDFRRRLIRRRASA